MFQSLRRWLSPVRSSRNPNRPGFRPSIVPLEDRSTPANIAVQSVVLHTPTSIGMTYQADVSFTVGVYRSADASLNAGDVPITTAVVGPGSQSTAIGLGNEIAIDPTRPNVIVVADPNGVIPETNEADNTGSFRKLALGVITHGLQPDGQLPPWVGAVATGMTAGGFDAVVVTDWAATSRLPLPGQATAAGTRMAQQVRAAADALGTLPTDVVDVQFIGHSRGTVVVSQALQDLERNPGPTELQKGYYQMTLLDSHPARNKGSLFAGYLEIALQSGRRDAVSTVGGFSFDGSNSSAVSFARSTLLFQALTNDPVVVVPANVDRTELFSQRNKWFNTDPTGFEYQTRMNLWGDRRQDLTVRSAGVFVAFDLPTTVGHTAVQYWYVANLPTYLPPRS